MTRTRWVRLLWHDPAPNATWGHMTEQEQERLRTLRSNPEKVHQTIHGCCGPAAILMSLLHGGEKARIDELVNCVTNHGVFSGVPADRARRVNLRINRRVTAEFINRSKYDAEIEDLEPGVELDAKLSIGLMLLLKEYLKNPENPPEKAKIWETCKEFSKNFKGWRYGDKKLKNAVSDREIIDPSIIRELEFIDDKQMSYKQGSFGLTPDAVLELAIMTGHTANKVSVESGGTITRPAGAAPGKAAAIIGLKEDGFNPGFGNIAHWVYAPKLPFDTSSDSVWTWGGKCVIGEGDLKDLEAHIAITLVRQ